jgi:hypothetical protein
MTGSSFPATARYRRNRRERGQAILLVQLSLSLLMFGALGLAVDGGQIFAHYQLAQTAADSAAQAAMMSIFDGTNATSSHPFATGSPPASFTCTALDQRTPCIYGRSNGFGSTTNDTVTVSFPSSVSGITLSSDAVPAVKVVASRTLTLGLMKFLGRSTAVVSATGEAAIVMTNNQMLLLITHPTLSQALSLGGNATVKVCGGPSKSIQVNSSSATATSSGIFDLSHAGPKDSGNCVSGTGADFGVFGGPAAAFSGLSLGTTGHYVRPASPILDPYASVAAPSVPSNAPAKTALANGISGCPASPKKSCNLYSPGYYSSGISVKNETAVFKPGLYYMGGGGFGNAANGDMVMSTGFASNPATGAGMVVYNSGSGTLGLGANSNATLVGSDASSTYKGILFFQDRSAAAQTHSLGGGGQITLTGSLYITNTLATMQVNAAHYQTLSMGGNSAITLNGVIVVGALSMGGMPNVTFNLAGVPSAALRQMSLVK